MAWKLDESKPVYIQLIEEIEIRILKGEYKSGTRLASVRDLAVEASVNPNTMQRAMQELERKGLVYTERTQGKYVTGDMELLVSLKEKLAKDIVDNFFKSLSEIGYSEQEIIKAVTDRATQQ